jgi:UPF0755 protein
MKNKKRTLRFMLIVFILCAAAIGFNLYSKIYSANVTQDSEIFIASNSDFDAVVIALHSIVANKNSFKWVATKKKYPNLIKAGKYLLKKGMNNNDLVNLLRSGNQTAVTLSFNNQDSLEKLAGRIATQIEPDSVTILKALTDQNFLKNNNFTLQSALGMYIPNSYQVYWNTPAENFRDRMLTEYTKFWSSDKRKKAAQQNLTPKEVSVLASIVQKETQTITERPKVARLYLNRLRNNWPLQADPTIIYAIKEKNGQDFVVKRVLYADLTIRSTYNTYRNKGLPPGPIGMPDISTINAVLHPDSHQFFYMCADTQNFGQHVFAKSLRQHNRNAAVYQKWLSNQGIRR